MRETKPVGLRCGSCASVWYDADARFCGRCGQPLDDRAATRPTGPLRAAPLSRAWERSWSGSLTAALVGVVTLVAAMLVASAIRTAIEPAAGPDRLAVDLPERPTADLSDGRPSSATGSAGEGPHRVTCRPPGCELWRADVGRGDVVAHGDVLVHSGAAGLSAISSADGDILWASPLARGSELIRPVVVAGDPLLLVADTAGVLEARSIEHGSVHWTASLPGPVDDVVVRPERVLVSGHVREVEHEDRGPDGGSPGFLASLDRATGEPRWTRAGVGVLSIEAEMPLVRLPADVIAGLDPDTGDAVWRLALSPMGSGPSEFAQGGGRVVIANGGGLTIIDGRTGEVERQVAVSVAPAGWIQVAGSVVLAANPSGTDGADGTIRLHQDSPATVTVVNLDDPEAEIRAFQDVIDVHWFTDEPPGGHPGRAPGGLVLAALDPGALVMHGLDATGEPVWRRHVLSQASRGGIDAACCWRLESGVHNGSFLVVPPAGGTDPVRVIAEDGSIATRFDRRLAQDRVDGPRWPEPIAVTLPGTSNADPTVVAGSRASVEVAGPTEQVATDPVVLATETGLLAIDPRLLSRES